jgi:hypothetical protein
LVTWAVFPHRLASALAAGKQQQAARSPSGAGELAWWSGRLGRRGALHASYFLMHYVVFNSGARHVDVSIYPTNRTIFTR